jgi:hypothetical protein
VVLCAVVLDICARTSTVRGRTDDRLAAVAAAVADIGTVGGVERIVCVADAAETNVSPQAPALDPEAAIPHSIVDGHSACVAEKECHGGKRGKEHVNGDLHLGAYEATAESVTKKTWSSES